MAQDPRALSTMEIELLEELDREKLLTLAECRGDSLDRLFDLDLVRFERKPSADVGADRAIVGVTDRGKEALRQVRTAQNSKEKAQQRKELLGKLPGLYHGVGYWDLGGVDLEVARALIEFAHLTRAEDGVLWQP